MGKNGGYMLGDKGFIAIVGAVMTVIYTSILVVCALVLVVLGGWKVSEMLWKQIKLMWRNYGNKSRL